MVIISPQLLWDLFPFMAKLHGLYINGGDPDCLPYGCFRKWWVFPPNHPFVHRDFHYFHHPFWGFSPYVWKHPYGMILLLLKETAPEAEAIPFFFWMASSMSWPLSWRTKNADIVKMVETWYATSQNCGKAYVQYTYLVACTLFFVFFSEFLRTKVRPKKYQTTNKTHRLKPPGRSVKDHQPLATKNHQWLASTLPFVGICDLGLTDFRCVCCIGCRFTQHWLGVGLLGWYFWGGNAIYSTYITNGTFWHDQCCKEAHPSEPC